MIIDQNLFQLEDKSLELIQQIKQSQAFQKYLNSKKEMEICPEVATIKQEFVSKKDKFEQIEGYGELAPDYKEQRRALRKAKRQLDLHSKVAEFRFAETDLQNLLDEVGQQIAGTISAEIKVDAGNPFFETGKAGCKGNCHG